MKHGSVRSAADCPDSSFHLFLWRGLYPINWGNELACLMLSVGSDAIDAVRSSPHPSTALTGAEKTSKLNGLLVGG